MKVLILISLVSLMASSCGKSKNNVNSGTVATTSGSSTIQPAALVDFEGVYDLVRMDSEDCGASIRIVNQCNGYMLLSNNLGPEEFCNINKGEFALGNDNNDRNPPLPDRNPPNPDRNPPPQKALVTQEGNLLKSIITLSPAVSFTNTLSLNEDGRLIKVSNLKSRQSRCIYQKR